jgi:hypothetical protein
MGMLTSREWAERPMFRQVAAPSVPSSTDEFPTSGTDQREMDEDEGMSKSERRIFFERLLDLRESYRRTNHRAGRMTAAQAIAYAETLLDDPTAFDAVLQADTPDATTRSNKAAGNQQSPHEGAIR